MLPSELTAIQEIHEGPDPYWSPSYSWTEADKPFVLDEGEQVLWWGTGNVEASGAESYKVQGLTIAVTDRRIVWFKVDFDQGDRRVGFGLIGAVVAVSANTVSKKRAEERSSGQVLIGQARFEWIRAVAEDHVTGPLKIQFYSCLVWVPTTEGEVFLEFDGGYLGGEGVAVWLAHLIRQRRALQASPLTSEQLSDFADESPQLQSSKSRGGGITRKIWTFPGDTDALIDAELASFYRHGEKTPKRQGPELTESGQEAPVRNSIDEAAKGLDILAEFPSAGKAMAAMQLPMLLGMMKDDATDALAAGDCLEILPGAWNSKPPERPAGHRSALKIKDVGEFVPGIMGVFLEDGNFAGVAFALCTGEGGFSWFIHASDLSAVGRIDLRVFGTRTPGIECVFQDAGEQDITQFFFQDLPADIVDRSFENLPADIVGRS